MRNPSLYLIVYLLAIAVFDSQIGAQEQGESRAAKLRRQLSSTRRVGYLRQREDDATGITVFVLKDAYDKSTYRIGAEPGLDLTKFVDRYVSLSGETKAEDVGNQRRFSAERVTALDGQEPVGARATNVRPAAFQADDARPLEEPVIELPGDSEDLRVAALTDDLPSPSEALEQTAPPRDVQVETLPNGYLPDGYAVEPPVLGFDWLRPPATLSNGRGGKLWVRAEYLLWLTDSLRTPALVSSSPNGTAQADAGVLGVTGTSVPYGIRSINNDPHSGGRLRAGYWWGDAKKIGVEGEYFALDEQTSSYQATSTGNPILARPYFDILKGQQAAELIAFPNVIRGDVQATALTNLRSGGLWMRFDPLGTGSPCEACSDRRLNWVLGYRYMRLEDDLLIRENTVTLNTPNPTTSLVQDSFSTDNKFHGVEVGAVYEADRGPVFIEAMSKVAVGNNHQVVDVAGASQITQAAVTQQLSGGLLAQRTNIGRSSRDEMAFVPQLGVTLGWRITRRLTLTAGYSSVYFSNVVRAGDQISTDLNPNLFPPEAVPFAGALRPEFAWRESDFWAHGLSFGADFRW